MDHTTRKSALDFLIWLCFGIILYFAIRRFFFILFPICLAFLFSQGIRASFKRLKPLSGNVKKVLVVLVLMIFFAFLSLVVILMTDRLFHGLASLSSTLSESTAEFSKSLQGFIKSCEAFFSNLLNRNLENRFQSSLPALLGKAVEQFAAKLPSLIGAIAGWIPRFFVSFIIFLLCTYYFSCDWERFSAFIQRKISKEKLAGLYRFKIRFIRGLKCFTRAYCILFLFTFSLVFFGLVIMGVKGAATKAFFIALVDLLPVFGCGTVLIPWALLSFLSGNISLGSGLLILYGIYFFLRQILEPKIIGNSIGLHPVLSLFLVLIGLYLFGFLGMILMPLIGTCLLQEKNEL